MRGCQGIPLPKKPAHGLRGSRPAARCSAAHQACGWGGAGPFLSQRRGSSPRPRGPSSSARPHGWPAVWRGPGPDAHVPAAGALPASRAQPSEPPLWLLRAPPSACSDGAGRDQHRWAPPRARPWANCVLSGLFPGLRGDGGRFLGGPATSWTQRSHVHGAHSLMENQGGDAQQWPPPWKKGQPASWADVHSLPGYKLGCSTFFLDLSLKAGPVERAWPGAVPAAGLRRSRLRGQMLRCRPGGLNCRCGRDTGCVVSLWPPKPQESLWGKFPLASPVSLRGLCISTRKSLTSGSCFDGNTKEPSSTARPCPLCRGPEPSPGDQHPHV